MRMKKRMLGLGFCLFCVLFTACYTVVTPQSEAPPKDIKAGYVETAPASDAPPEAPHTTSWQLYDLIFEVPLELDVFYSQGRELAISVILTTVEIAGRNLADHLMFGVAPERGAPLLPIEPTDMHRDTETIHTVFREGRSYVGGMPAYYMEASFFRADQPEESWHGIRYRVVYGEFRYSLAFRAPSSEQFERHRPIVEALIATARFDSEEDPLQMVALMDITLQLPTRDVDVNISEHRLGVTSVRNLDHILRFYARVDTNLPFTEHFFDHTPALDVLLRERTEPMGPWWEMRGNTQTINLLEPRELLREEIDLNGHRVIRAVFHDDFRQFDNYVELFLFVHNGTLYTLFGQSDQGDEDALQAFLAPILDSIQIN